MWPPTCSLVYAIVHVGRLSPPTSPLCAVRVSGAEIKKKFILCFITIRSPRKRDYNKDKKEKNSTYPLTLWNCARRILVTSRGERGKQQMRRDFSMMTPEICTAHICARLNANMRRTSPKPTSWWRGKFRASGRKRSRRCVTLMRTPLASVSGAQQKKSKKTSQSKRGAFCE